MQVIKYTAADNIIEMHIENGNVKDYPKYLKVGAMTRYGLDDNKQQCILSQEIRIIVALKADAVNKGENEAGLKRLHSFIKTAKKLYGEISLERKYSYPNDNDLPSSILDLV